MASYAKERLGGKSENYSEQAVPKREYDLQWATDRINAFMENTTVAEYVEASRKSGYLIWSEAAERKIPEATFRKLSKAFQITGEIVREPGIGLKFAAGPKEEDDGFEGIEWTDVTIS